MRVVCAKKEQHDWYTKKEFLRGRVLGSIINLLPHVQIVVGPGIELKWHASDPMEHEEGSKHIGYIRHGPRRLLGNSWDYVEEDF